MKRKLVDIGQFAYSTKDLEGDNEEFLNSIAPEIGYIVHEFNSLEETLTSFICQLISDRGDDKGLIITYKMSYSQKVELFKRYTEWVQNVCQTKISLHHKMIENLKECGKLRNMVVHAEWQSFDEDGYTLVKVKFNKNGLQQEYIQFDLESLNKIRNIIIETSDLLWEYEQEFYKKTLKQYDKNSNS